MIRYAAFILLLAATSLTSCNQEIKEERLKRIDSLGTHLNHVSEVIASVDSAMIQSRLDEMDRNANWLNDNINGEIKLPTAIKFGDYMRCQKFYGKALNRYRKVKSELQYSEKQMETLRKDVKNSFYSDEEFEGYFRTEAEAIKSLIEATDELEGSYDAVNEQYMKTKPAATSILDSIKSVIYSSEPLI
ncbi:MAG: hypothetical protein R2813_01065 [Flavobacteriales bacterium]